MACCCFDTQPSSCLGSTERSRSGSTHATGLHSRGSGSRHRPTRSPSTSNPFFLCVMLMATLWETDRCNGKARKFGAAQVPKKILTRKSIVRCRERCIAVSTGADFLCIVSTFPADGGGVEKTTTTHTCTSTHTHEGFDTGWSGHS